MKHIKKTIAKILIVAFIITNIITAFPGISLAASNTNSKIILRDRDKSQIIVKYYDDSNSSEVMKSVNTKMKLKEFKVTEEFKKEDINVIEIGANDNIDKVITELKKDKRVKYAQPNYPLTVSEVSDPQWSKQWGLLNNGQSVEGLTGRSNVDINAINAWNITQGSDKVIVGLLDSGVDINHEDLKDNLVAGYDFVEGDAIVNDKKNPERDIHGTQVAGIIAAASNSTGITGVAPKVKIMPLKFINGTVGYTSDAIAAIEYAMSKGVKIINCSFAGSDNNAALKDAMQNSGILFICSAGNKGADTSMAPVYPACFDMPNVISAAALDSKGVLANFSSYGKDIDVAAPGVNILTTTPGNTYDYLSGTSASAPFVTGIAALLKSYLPDLTVTQISERIKQNAVQCTKLKGKVASGRVNAYAALTNTKPAEDTYEGPGNDVDTVPPGQEPGDTDSWYTQDQLSKIKGRLHYGESGVNPGSGNYSFTVNDMSIAAPGFTINMSRTYNSADDKQTPLGRGWTFGFEGSAKGSDLVTVILPTGAVQRFRQSADAKTYAAEDSRSTFAKNTNNTYILTTKDQYTYGFDANGWLNWMKDRNGNTVNITVDALGKVTKITDTVGREYTVTYNAKNPSLIESIADAESRKVKYEYDANNRLSTVTDPMGGKMYYEYDGYGYLTKIKDNNTNIIEALTYSHTEGDNLGKVTQATDALGNIVDYAYDVLNKKTTITDQNKRVSTYWFNNEMYTTKVQDPDGRCSLTDYYLNCKYGDIRATTDRNGNRVEYSLDDRGNTTKKLYFANNSTEEFTYDDKNNVVAEKDANGNSTYYIYDQNKINLLKKVQPLNGTDSYTDGVSNLSNPEKYAITVYSYYTSSEAVSLFKCSASGLLKTTEDPEHNITQYTYDSYGNTATTKDPENNIVSYEYNKIGWQTAAVSAKKVRTELNYDKNGQLIKSSIVKGNNETTRNETTRVVYDILGRKIQEISPEQYNQTKDDIVADTYSDNTVGTRYEYDNKGMLIKTTDPEGNITSYTYDIYGNTLTETQPNGAVLRYEYDVMDRPVKTYFKDTSTAQETLLSEKSYAVLEDGKTQITETAYLNSDEKAITVSIYDYADRLVEQQNPDGTKLINSYNPNGTANSATAQNGSTTYFKYDGLNRLTQQWIPFEVVNGNILYSYAKTEYDKANNKISETKGIEKVALNSVPKTYTKNNYTYYKNGKIKAATDLEGRKTEYAYDADGNVSKQDIYTDSINKKTTEYEYNYLGKVSKKLVHVQAGDLEGNSSSDTTDKTLATSYAYTKNGNLETVTDPKGIVTAYTYDNLNRQLTVTQPGVDENNRPVTIQTATKYYYEQSDPVTTTDANGSITNYSYNQRGLLTKTVDAKGGVTAYDYDLAGRKIVEVSPKNYQADKTLDQMNRVQYVYDKMGRIKTKMDIYQDPATKQWITVNTKSYKYDNSGNVIKELDALGYDSGSGTAIDERINNGYGTELTYNLANQAVTTLDAESKQRALAYTTKNEYDAQGRKISEVNARGVISLYAYDDAGNIKAVKVKKNQSAAEQVQKTNIYDLANRLISQTDGNGNTTTYEYTSFDKVRKTIYPSDQTIDSNTLYNQYDENGNLKKQWDSTGKESTSIYDNQGRILSSTTNDITTSASYDKNGNKRFETDANGTTKENKYDELNRLISTTIIVSGKTQTTSYTYDANDNQTTTTDWRGNTSTNIYDPLNRLIEKQDPYTTIQRLTYYKNNLQSTSTDALGNITTYTYDRNGRQESTTDPEGHKTSQSYDDAGNVQTKIDGRGISTTYNYDEFNQLKSVVNPKGETTSYTYDLNGNKLTQTDGKGNTTIYQYNAANKVTKKIDPNGTDIQAKTESYTYYADGSLKTKIDRNGKTTYYNYDVYGRLLNRTIDNGSVSYTYDNNGNQLTMTDSTGTTTRIYDQLGRVLTKTVPKIGKSIYIYDITETVPEGCTGEKTTDPKGNETLKVNDKAGRLYTVTANNKTTTYSYYENGSRKSVTYPNGNTENYTYYKDNLLKELVNKKANGNVMDDYTYTYDAAHNQTSKHELVNSIDKGTTSYVYDSLNRLETVKELGKTTAYTFDKAGNRQTETVTTAKQTTTTKANAIGTATTATTQTTITTYTYNDQNRLEKTVTQKGGETERIDYRYDANGNMTSKESSVSKNTPTGAPASVTAAIAGQSGQHWKTTYKYDNWNQLIKTLSDQTTTYAYNGEGYRTEKTENGTTALYLYEADKVVLETDGAGNQTSANVYGTNLISRTMSSETAYYQYNGHADVTALTTENGGILASYRYDAFGNTIEKNENTGLNNPYRYAGYRYDDKTDLYYLNARYYDSKIARFMTEDTYTGTASDPLSLNLYVYCHNEPVMYIDPTGHMEDNDKYIDKKSDEYKKIQKAGDTYRDASNRTGIYANAPDYVISAVKAQAHADAEKARLDYALKRTKSGDTSYAAAKYGTNTANYMAASNKNSTTTPTSNQSKNTKDAGKNTSKPGYTKNFIGPVLPSQGAGNSETRASNEKEFDQVSKSWREKHGGNYTTWDEAKAVFAVYEAGFRESDFDSYSDYEKAIFEANMKIAEEKFGMKPEEFLMVMFGVLAENNIKVKGNYAAMENGSVRYTEGTSKTNSFNMDKLDSFKNAKITDVEKYLDNTLEGFTKAPLKKGDGVRYFDGKGNSYQLNYGYENASDAVHGGPYLKTTSGSEIIRIPLTK